MSFAIFYSQNPNISLNAIYSIRLRNIDFPRYLLVQENGRMIPVLHSDIRIYTPIKTSQTKLSKVTADKVLS